MMYESKVFVVQRLSKVDEGNQKKELNLSRGACFTSFWVLLIIIRAGIISRYVISSCENN